ncbi:MAG: hypothetical protein ACOY3M_05620 [Patescibacteria group bacterium]
MEKPSPTYDNFARYSIRSYNDDTRYKDRLTLRGIPQLTDTDEEENKPRWRGDHTYNSEAASYSLTHFIEPEVRKAHPDWTHEEVQKEATQRFKERLAQDLSYEHKENAHEESEVRWEKIRVADGSWELATSYGDKMITLNELWEHTKEYAAFAGNPDAYNRDEHAAQLAMQEQLISGNATGFVSVLSHPDAVRYVQIWQKSEDGGVISKHVDLFKTTGTDFTHEEGADFIRHLARFHDADTLSSEVSSYAHFFLKEKNITESDIRTIAIAQTMERVREAPSPHVSTEYVRIVGDVARDSKKTFIELGVFLKEHIDKKIALVKNTTDIPKKEKTRRLPIGSADRHPVTEATRAFITVRHIDTAPNAHLRTDTMRSTDSMKSVAAEWVVMQTMLRYSPVIPTGAGALIFWFTRPLEQIQPEKRKQMGIPHAEEKNTVLPPARVKEKNPRISLRSLFRLVSEAGKRAFVRSEKQKNISSTIAEKTPKKPAEPGNSEVPAVRLSLPFVERLLHLYRTLIVEKQSKPHGVKKRDTRDANIPEQLVAQAEEKATRIVKDMGIAIIVWLLVEWERTIVCESQALPAEHEVVFADTPEIPDGKKQSSWLLFAIIWYLSALREHGKPGSFQQKKTGKKRKKKTTAKSRRFLPSSGIIFTYGS